MAAPHRDRRMAAPAGLDSPVCFCRRSHTPSNGVIWQCDDDVRAEIACQKR